MWAHVIVAPEERRMVVLSKGTSKGLIAAMPVGGQEDPTSMFGLREA